MNPGQSIREDEGTCRNEYMAVLLSWGGFWAFQEPLRRSLRLYLPLRFSTSVPYEGHILLGQFHCLRFRLLCSMLSLPTGSQATRSHAEWRGQWKDTLNRVKAFSVYLLRPWEEKRGLWNIPGAGGRPLVSVLFKPGEWTEWKWEHPKALATEQSEKKHTHPVCPAMTNGFFHSL